MKIACPKCGREYRLDPSRIPAKGARFTCWGCQAKVEVRPLQAGQGEATVAEASSSKDLKDNKQAVSEAKATVNTTPAPLSSSQITDKDDSDSFLTGPGIKKSALAKSEPIATTPTSEPTPNSKALDTTSQPPSTSTNLKTVETGVLKTGNVKPQPLKITCPKCQHEYRIDPSRIPGGGGKFTCRNCQARIEVRPNQKLEEPTGQKVSTSKYQTPPVAQPTMPGIGLSATESKTKKEDDLNRPGPITGPFSIKSSAPKVDQTMSDSTKVSDDFEGESTMVMGSSSAQLKKAKEEAQAGEEAKKTAETSFNFSDPNKEIETPKAPTFDFTDLTTKSSTDNKQETSFSFSDSAKDTHNVNDSFSNNDDATPTAVTIAKGPSGNLGKVSDFPLDANSTLAMNNADIASAIEAKTKTSEEEQVSSSPEFGFSFDLNETKISAIAKAAPPLVDDPNATTAIPAAQLPGNSQSARGPNGIFEAPTELEIPVNGGNTESELDKNKTSQLSPQFTFNLDVPVGEVSEPKKAEEVKEVTSGASFSFVPTTSPMLEKPISETEQENKKPAFSLDKPFSQEKTEEENKANVKIPPPPGLKGDLSTSKDDKSPFLSSSAPELSKTPKAEAPKIELPKPKVETPKIELPKPKSEPAKKEPVKQEEKKEIKTEELPTPIYNPDIFSPPPSAEETSSGFGGLLKGLFKGLLVGATLALIAIAYWGLFLKSPATSTSSPSPTETEIAKNTPKVVETPDESTNTPVPKTSPTAKASETPNAKASSSPTPKVSVTPTPKASETPKTTPTPKVTPTPKTTPTPRPTVTPDKPATGNVPDSVSGTGKFTLQVRATQSQAEAETLGKKLRGTGAEAYVVKADLGAKGIWYRVRIGRYSSLTDAQKAGAELRSKGAVTEFLATTY